MSLRVVASALIVLAIVDVLCTAFLVRAAYRIREIALTERAIVSIILTLIAGGSALLAADYLFREVQLPASAGTFILSAGLLMVSLPQIVWAVLHWRGGFR